MDKLTSILAILSLIFSVIWWVATMSDKLEAASITGTQNASDIRLLHDDIIVIKERVTQVWKDNGHHD